MTLPDISTFAVDENTLGAPGKAVDTLSTAADKATGIDAIEQTLDRVTGFDYGSFFMDLAADGVWIVFKIFVAIAFWYFGRWLIRRLMAFLNRVYERRGVDLSLRSFLSGVVKALTYVVLVLTIVQVLGINTTSIVALLASAGLAIGMALSGTLQNFAGGVMILLFRPYKVGDYIMAQGQAGTVTDIRIFSTQIRTVDNRVIYIPNNSISTSIIDNYSQERLRRVDWSVSVGYGVDAERVKSLLLSIIATDSRVVAEPAAPVVYLASMNESSVTFSARAWVRNADYWDTFFEINEKIYGTLPAEGISFPYPKLDVTINNNNKN